MIPTTDRARVADLADILIEARTERRALDPLPDELIPTSEAEAAAVDDRVAEISGWTVRGWKIGCTSKHAQELLGSPGPFAGRVYSLFEGDTTLGADALMTEPNLEGEFAFTLGTDLAPQASGFGGDEILDAIETIHPAIEIVGGRFARFVGTPLLCLVADAGANSHLVLGPPVSDWDADTLPATAARMEVDGRPTGEGTGADVLNGPLTALGWLVDHLTKRGIILEAGQVVTTGTATQVSALPVGSTATATLDGIGSVSLTRR